MMQYKTVLELFRKLHTLIYASQFVHDITDYPTFICPVESGEVQREREKITVI